eukprot:TRINITY_DN1707_c0_g1_i1.p2 TRINITY_DN1707_c0_g1~~TRINITY_DN1707_c0_g1_i1.p2  ORF type:complete len:128 (+),score=26.37 TRINITY_DN1707_c0_g1_i1:140-523(+)
MLKTIPSLAALATNQVANLYIRALSRNQQVELSSLSASSKTVLLQKIVDLLGSRVDDRVLNDFFPIEWWDFYVSDDWWFLMSEKLCTSVTIVKSGVLPFRLDQFMRLSVLDVGNQPIPYDCLKSVVK